MKRQILIIDWECLPYDWCVTIALPFENRLVQIWNDHIEFQRFFKEHKDDIWIGYNIRSYDQYITKAVVCGFDPWDVNKHIITYGKQGWTFSDAFRQVDFVIYDVLKGFRSLKELEGFMLDDIRESKIDFNTYRQLTDEEMEDLLYYNRHDVLETVKVFEKRVGDFRSQLTLINLFHLPIRNLSKTTASLNAVILQAERMEHNDEMDIDIPPTLRLDKYRFVLDWYLNPMNRDYTKSLECEIEGMKCQFGWGGAHGSRDGIILKNKAIIDADVTSLYPSLMIQYDYFTRNIPRAMKKRYAEIYYNRIKAKKEGNKTIANAYKLSLNSTFGTFKDKTSPMYDPKMANNICVAGQLFILDYVEQLSKIPSVVFLQINTDGVFFVYNGAKETFDAIDDATYEFEKRTHLNMEFENYCDMYQANVNNYVAVAKDGSTHAKGILFKEKNSLDNDMPIIREAIFNYVVNDVPIEKTIKEETELWKFQKIVKLSSNYRKVTRKVKTINGKTMCDDDGIIEGKTFRIFASKDKKDNAIYKVKSNDSAMRWGDTPEHVFIVNEDVKDMKCPDKLDREYYVSIAYKKANAVKDLDSLF